MIRTKQAKKLLTKKEQRHLTQMGVHTMAGFVSMAKEQRRMEQESLDKGMMPGIACPCFECKTIARKLGV